MYLPRSHLLLQTSCHRLINGAKLRTLLIIDMFAVIAEVFSFWPFSVEIWLIYSFWQ